MADTFFGQTKVNGFVQTGEHVSGTFETIQIVTSVNILLSTDTNGSATSQAALDKLIGIVNLRGQPIILNAPVRSGSNPNYLYTVTMTTEHAGAWGNATPTLAATIASAGVNYGFGSDVSLAVTIS